MRRQFGRVSHLPTGRGIRAERTPAPDAAPPTPARALTEREDRRLVFRNALLTLDSVSRLEVVVKDVTADGVRVASQARMRLPDYVTLIERSLQINRRARVVWQDINSAGLEFID